MCYRAVSVYVVLFPPNNVWMTHTETSLCFVFVIFNNDFFTLYVLNPIIQHAGAGQTARIRSLLQHTILGPTAAFNSTRDFATGRSFVCGDGSCIDCHKCHTYICHVVTCIIVGSPSPACLVYRTLASCGSRHRLGMVLALARMQELVS